MITHRIHHFTTVIVSFTQLLRLSNSLALGLLFLSSRHHFLDGIVADDIFKAITWVFIAAFSYAYNDLCDVNIDQVNHPYRPLPSGVISITKASRIVFYFGALLLGVCIIVWRGEAIWPIAALAGGIVYSRVLRPRHTLLSNLLACALVALVSLSAVYTIKNVQAAALVTAIGIITFAREIHKDILDARGDMFYRPRALLDDSRYKTMLYSLYPWVLALAAGLLYISVVDAGSSILICIITLLPMVTAILTIIVFIKSKSDHRLQSRLLKLTCYLLVLALAV